MKNPWKIKGKGGESVALLDRYASERIAFFPCTYVNARFLRAIRTIGASVSRLSPFVLHPRNGVDDDEFVFLYRSSSVHSHPAIESKHVKSLFPCTHIYAPPDTRRELRKRNRNRIVRSSDNEENDNKTRRRRDV